MRRTLLMGTALALLTMAAGCSDGTPSASTPPTSSSSAQVRTASAAELQTAIKRLRSANTGSWRLAADVGSNSVRQTGSYRLRPAAFDLVEVIHDGSDSVPAESRDLTIHQLIIHGQLWLQLKQGETPDPVCWLEYDAATIKSSGLEIDPRAAPAPIDAVLGGVGARTEGAFVVGTVDLATGLRTLGSQAVTSFGVGDAKARLPARFDLFDGTLVSWSEDLADVPAAMRAAGLSVPTAVASLDSYKSSGGSLDVTVDLAEAGGHVSFLPPPPAQVVAMSEVKKGQDPNQACAAR